MDTQNDDLYAAAEDVDIGKPRARTPGQDAWRHQPIAGTPAHLLLRELVQRGVLLTIEGTRIIDGRAYRDSAHEMTGKEVTAAAQDMLARDLGAGIAHHGGMLTAVEHRWEGSQDLPPGSIKVRLRAVYVKQDFNFQGEEGTWLETIDGTLAT